MRGTLEIRNLVIPPVTTTTLESGETVTQSDPRWHLDLKTLLDRMQLDLQFELNWLHKTSASVGTPLTSAAKSFEITSPRMDVETEDSGTAVTLVSADLKGPVNFHGPLYLRKTAGTVALSFSGTTIAVDRVLILSRHAGVWYPQVDNT